MPCISEVDAAAKEISARLNIEYIDISTTISHWEKINGATDFGAINMYLGLRGRGKKQYTDLTLMHNITHLIIETLERESPDYMTVKLQ